MLLSGYPGRARGTGSGKPGSRREKEPLIGEVSADFNRSRSGKNPVQPPHSCLGCGQVNLYICFTVPTIFGSGGTATFLSFPS